MLKEAQLAARPHNPVDLAEHGPLIGHGAQHHRDHGRIERVIRGGQPLGDAVANLHRHRGLAGLLPAADDSFDAAVVTMVLCSVADQRAVLREIHRVVRPGGQLRFLEHVQAGTPGWRRVQRLVDATIWPLLIGGCHTGRDTLGAIASTGFTVEQVDEFRFPPTRWSTPTTWHVSGVAVRDP